MIPGAFEPNAPPHRQSTGVVVHTEPPPDAAATQVPYPLTASREPTTRAAQGAAVLGDVALALGLIFALVLVPVLAIKGIAAAVGLLMAALRGGG